MIIIKKYVYPTGHKEVIMHSAVENLRNNGKGGRVAGRGAGETKIENIQRRIYRVKRDIRRLALLNELTRMMTLTFRENIEDIDEADMYFKRFIYALRVEGYDLRYIMVRERQARGAIHYHCLIDKFIPHKIAYDLWLKICGSGSVNFRFKGFKGINYCIKYVEKNIGENIMCGVRGYTKKTYTCSRNLNRDMDSIMIKTFAFAVKANDEGRYYRFMGPGVDRIMSEIELASRQDKILYMCSGEYGPENEFQFRSMLIAP